MTGVLTVGEGLALLRATEPGGLEHAHELRLGTGGAEGNVAIGLARLGVPVRWAGRLGDDGLGRRVARELRAEGVRVTAILDPGASTGLMLKHAEGGRTIVDYYRAGSAGSRLSPEDVAGLDLAGVALVHVTGITLAISQTARAAVGELVARAREASILVSFDVNHRSGLWDAAAAADHYRRLAAQADLVFAGVEEAVLLVGDGGPDQLGRRILELGAREAVVKLGADGCFATTAEAGVRQAAVPVDPIDTVGAGDAFVAGYLSQVLAGADLAARARTGVRAGAFACLSPGDWEGLPYPADLLRLAGQPGDPVVR